MTNEEFKCAMCKKHFEKTCSEEEAVAELQKTFPGFTPDDCDVVCDDCFNLFMASRL